MNKYRAKKTVVDGITFDSKKEANRYAELLLLQRAGQIHSLELQPRIKLQVKGVPIVYRSGRQAYYQADFRYIENSRYVVEDVKGMKTSVYKLKDAILRAMGICVVET